MTSIFPTDRSDEVEFLATLEQRIADLEARSRSSDTWRGWFRSLLRWLATAPPLLILLVVALDRLSSATGLSLGILLVVVWASAAVLWAAVEVLAGGDKRFRLTRLILIVAMFAVIFGYWEVGVFQPYRAEQSCLANLKGLSPDVRREPIGPAWLIGLIGQAPFQRVVAIELGGPEADKQQIRRLHALPHLNNLWLSGPRFDDDILDDVAALAALESIVFNSTNVTEAGAERLRRARPWLQVFCQ